MKHLFVLTLLTLCCTLSLQASKYRVNEEAVDSAFENSIDVSHDLEMLGDPAAYAQAIGAGPSVADDKAQTAAIIAFASFVVRYGSGILSLVPYGWAISIPLWALSIVPWHRYYLGTGGEGFKIGALYCVTLGWCIHAHHVIDGIMLLMHGSEQYVDNPKYVMWAKD